MAHIRRELSVPSDTSCLFQVRQAVLEVVSASALAPVKANLIALAVDEAVANVMEHAAGEDGNGNENGNENENENEGRGAAADRLAAASDAIEIHIVLELTERAFVAVVRDNGAGFDPRVVPEVDVQAHVKAGKRGGLGICLMRRIMDEIQYSYKQERFNELRMVKYLDEERPES